MPVFKLAFHSHPVSALKSRKARDIIVRCKSDGIISMIFGWSLDCLSEGLQQPGVHSRDRTTRMHATQRIDSASIRDGVG